MNPYRRFHPLWWKYWLIHFIPEVWWNLRVIWEWLPVLWGLGDFDWAYLAKVMEFQLTRMSSGTKHWVSQGSSRAGREMQICAHLLRRLRQDDYTFKCMPFDGDYRRAYKRGADGRSKALWPWHKHMGAIQEQDMDLLFKIMRRKMRTWWD